MYPLSETPAVLKVNKNGTNTVRTYIERPRLSSNGYADVIPHSDTALLSHLNFPFLQDCSKEEVQLLRERLAFKRLPKKAFVYLPHERDTNIYFIIHGNVELGYLDESGRELSIDILSQGDIFGSFMQTEDSFEQNTGSFARSVGKVLLGELHREDFAFFLQRSPRFLQKVHSTLRQRIHHLEKKLQTYVFSDVKTRICKLLLGFHEKFGDRRSGKIRIQLTHQDIANLVASSRETASLHLSELKKSGIIDYERKVIRILSLEKLYQTSGAQ